MGPNQIVPRDTAQLDSLHGDESKGYVNNRLKDGFLAHTQILLTIFGESTISHCLKSQPPETTEEKDEETGEETLEVHPYKPPVHKPWVSLGSEKEVEEESIKESVPKVRINECYSVKQISQNQI